MLKDVDFTFMTRRGRAFTNSYFMSSPTQIQLGREQIVLLYDQLYSKDL